MATITKEKLLEEVKKIPDTAKKEKWVFTRDFDEGTLFYSPGRMPDNTELHQVSDEYALYLDKNDLALKGVVVEYYSNNFVEHHPEFKEITDEIFDTEIGKERIVVNPEENSDVERFTSMFESAIIAEAVKNPID